VDCDRKTQMISTHLRYVGHNWGFNPEQKELLDCYCDANKLLIDCLNSSCVVSNEVREEIENTLLLPPKSKNANVKKQIRAIFGRSPCAIIEYKTY
jgi:hypothetical protein